MDERDEGREEGEKLGIIKSNMNSLRKIMSKFNMTIDKAMEIIDIHVNEKPMYREKILAMQ